MAVSQYHTIKGRSDVTGTAGAAKEAKDGRGVGTGRGGRLGYNAKAEGGHPQDLVCCWVAIEGRLVTIALHNESSNRYRNIHNKDVCIYVQNSIPYRSLEGSL